MAIFGALESDAAWFVGGGKPQNVADVAWACAALGVQSPSLFRAINSRAAWLVEYGKPRAIASAAWACGALDVQSPSLFRSIEKNAAWLMKDARPRDVARVAWACATLGVRSPALFRSIKKKAAWLAADGEPQDVLTTAWACAKLDVRCPSLFQSIKVAIKDDSAWLLKDGTTQDLANTAWAFAKQGIPAPSLFRFIDSRAAWLVQNGTPEAVANVAWAFAELDVQPSDDQPPSLFQRVDESAAWLVENGTSRDVANAAVAFAKVGIVRPDRLLRSLAEGGRLDRFLEEASSREVCSLAWAVAVLGIKTSRDASLLLALWAAALLRDSQALVEGKEPTAAEGLCQLAHVRLHARAAGVALSPALPPALKARMVSACEEAKEGNSRFKAEYSRLLTEIGFEHEREVPPFGAGGDDGGGDFGDLLAIDMACRKLKVAVECDGRSHFLTSLAPLAQKGSGKRNGPTAAKRRLLQQLGWRVVNVPFFDDVSLESEEYAEKATAMGENGGGKRELKKLYLKGRLANVGVVLK